VQSDSHEEEVEVGEVLDQFSARCKNVFAYFGGMEPQEERVPSLELVVIHIDKTK